MSVDWKSDPYLPRYHFFAPGVDCEPGDPNGAFFADGVYHLMFLYRKLSDDGLSVYHWGHLTSRDLLHWSRRPDALTACNGDGGAFSGGAFVDEDRTAYLTFWKLPAKKDRSDDKGAVAVARAQPPYDEWTRMEPVAVEASEWGIHDLEINGETRHIACADPSNIWKRDGMYYMQLGNLCVLDRYGRNADSPGEYRGGWTDLFRSADLTHWNYAGRFYRRPDFPGAPDDGEDDMCPSFLPLYDAPAGGKFTGKYLQLFISHNRGCQYFTGHLEGETFAPECHGRMSWNDSGFFAPEALIDDRNRQVMWAWLRHGRPGEYSRFGWSGVYCFPRVLWWQRNALHMAPAEELDALQADERQFAELPDGIVPVETPDSFRARAVFAAGSRQCAGVSLESEDGGHTDIFYEPAAESLVLDTTHTGGETRLVRESAPLSLQTGEPLAIDFFIDRCVAEVYANERQAIARLIFPAAPIRTVRLIGGGTLRGLSVWRMRPADELARGNGATGAP